MNFFWCKFDLYSEVTGYETYHDNKFQDKRNLKLKTFPLNPLPLNFSQMIDHLSNLTFFTLSNNFTVKFPVPGPISKTVSVERRPAYSIKMPMKIT